MTMTIADLVVKLRSDGVQQAKQDVQAVGDAAKATAQQIDALAKKLATSQGGDTAGWTEMLQRTGMSYADAFKAVGEGTQKTVAAAEQIKTSTGGAATAAKELGAGFDLSTGTLLRAAGALTGVGLGLSAAVGGAHLLHDAISGVVDSQLTWEQSLVRVNALYGNAAPNVVAFAQAQAQSPGLLGTQQEFLSAAMNSAYLSTRYGVPQADVNLLTTSAGAASEALGYNPDQRASLQTAALQFAEGGGSSLLPYGQAGTPLDIARAVGGISPDQLNALTPSQLRQAQLLLATRTLDTTAIQGDGTTGGLLAAQRAKEQALAQAQSNLQNTMEGASSPQQQQLATDTALFGAFSAGTAEENKQAALADLQAPARAAVQKAQQEYDDTTKALGDHQKAIADATEGLNKLGVAVNSATFRMLGFAGNPEDSSSIARGDIAAQALANVAQRAVGPNALPFKTQAELNVQATNDSYQQAYQQFVANKAQQSTDNGLRDQLQQMPGGIAAIADAQRRQGPNQAFQDAQKSGALANLQIQQSQNDLDEIALRQKGRLLDVTQQIADAQKNALLIARDNLGNEQQLIQARQAELGPQAAVMGYDYQTQRVQLLARQRQARMLLGEDVSGTPDLGALQSQYVNLTLGRAASGVDLKMLDTAHAADVAGLAVTGGNLAQQGAELPATAAQIDVTIKNLGDTAEQIAADLRLIQGQQAAINAQRGATAAQGALANVQLVINADGTVRLADDAIKAAAQAAYDLTEQELTKAALETGNLDLPAPTPLAGARRGGPY